MAFGGYLLKIDGRELPLEYIKLSSYDITPEQEQDLDPYRDVIGILHRNVLQHAPSKIELQLKMLHEKHMVCADGILGEGRSCQVEYFNPKRHGYSAGRFYIPARTYSIYRIDTEKNDIIYNPQRVALIEY